ncbi:hypothetical protein [Gordonia sp. HS-NH1]|uniref:hypothetical protein n=1 Tax=Gordonia sp. HS-NH1 TaxID=1435068 RepID=UPI0006E16317|nr:hypothetical protein [Gordonia sp. HS-NH1]
MSDDPEEFTTMSDPQRAAARVAANFASGDCPREPHSRAAVAAQLGAVKPRRRRGGRSEASKRLAREVLEDQ